MNERLTQIQEQKQDLRQVQAISQQKLLHAQLVELPLPQLLERIDTEMHDNPALESSVDPEYAEYAESPEPSDFAEDAAVNDDYESRREREERQSALDDALKNIGRDDEELPVYHGGTDIGEDREEIIYGDTTSF